VSVPLSQDEIACATVRIECDDSTGSGFHFLRPELVATNHHVVADAPDRAAAVAADGTSWSLELLGYSAEDEDDFALFRADGVGGDRLALLPPGKPGLPELGRQLVFSGFPHGISDLLVQGGTVAGHEGDESFYTDASINAGNSGGPAIDQKLGQVVGQIYASRFLGASQLEHLSDEAEKLAKYCERIAVGGSVQLMGIDFGAFAHAVAQSNILLAEALRVNANTGIGLARNVVPLLEAAEDVGFETSSARKAGRRLR
jgi:hypothetical protein